MTSKLYGALYPTVAKTPKPGLVSREYRFHTLPRALLPCFFSLGPKQYLSVGIALRLPQFLLSIVIGSRRKPPCFVFGYLAFCPQFSRMPLFLLVGGLQSVTSVRTSQQMSGQTLELGHTPHSRKPADLSEVGNQSERGISRARWVYHSVDQCHLDKAIEFNSRG